jgi:hypothetical protein
MKSNHHCHANGCATPTDPKLFMCLEHWNMVPAMMQKEIWSQYKGTTREQRFEKIPYLQACALAVEHVAELEGKDSANSYRKLISIAQVREENRKLREKEAQQHNINNN